MTYFFKNTLTNRPTLSKLKEVEAAISLMPSMSKKIDSAYNADLRFSKKVFGSTLKEILKYRLSK